jgi:hypothetical protein
MKLRIATCNLAVAAAIAALAPTSASAALEAPTSGSLNIWFKAPVSNSIVSGQVQLDKCYVRGTGVSRVEFFLDSTRLNTDSTMSDGMSCVLDTTKFANGTHKLRAVAYNSSGSSYTETTSINIQNAASGGSSGGSSGDTGGSSGTAPTISFKQPSSGGTLSGAIKDSALCEVTGSGFIKVSFHLDDKPLNTELNAPWHCSFDTKAFSNGTHTLKATAYNAAGAATVAQIPVTISNGTTGGTDGGTSSPTTPSANGLTITSPQAGATLSGSSNACAASAPKGTNYVRFYRDGVWLNTDNTLPYGCNIDVSRLANGTHKLKAISYGAYNVVTAQTEISFNVGTGGSTGGGTGTPTNAAPSVSLTAPAVNAVLSNTATCAASAGDADGAVSKVEFILGSAVVASDTGAPYSCSFDTTKYQNGTYTFTARATDNLGKVATASRSVTVKNDVVSEPSTGGGGTVSSISSSDIVNHIRADVPFSQQSGFNTQALGQYLMAPDIPETGLHAFALQNGETLRLGKHIDPRNSSRKVLAFQVDPRDVSTSGAKRSEFKLPGNIDSDRVYWASMSVYVYDWGTLSTADDGLFGIQLHSGNTLGLSPTFSVVTSGTGRTFQVMALGSSSTSPSYANTLTKRSADLPIPFGRWVDFVFKFKLNPSGNGFLQVWMDGTQILNHSGVLGYITPGEKPYFKFGYYNWSGSGFASTRKVLVRSPVVVADPTGKYQPEDLRAYVNAH